LLAQRYWHRTCAATFAYFSLAKILLAQDQTKSNPSLRSSTRGKAFPFGELITPSPLSPSD
jgi:hypothetical protein